MMVELGGGTNPHPRADLIIDLHHPKGTHAQDATVVPWAHGGRGDPIAAGSVDEVYASHFMEHVHRGDPLIRVMNEAWRVLKPGGTFFMVMPLVGFTDTGGSGHLVSGWQPYADPTHVNFWWMPEAFLYFCEGPFKPHANYGISVWGQLGQWVEPEVASERFEAHRKGPLTTGSWWSVRDGWEGLVCLTKP